MVLIKPGISNNVSLTPGVALITKTSNFFSRRTISLGLNSRTFPARKHALPLSTSVRPFPDSRSGCILKPKAITDVTVDAADLSPADNKTEIDPIKSKRFRPVRKSEMPPVKNEELTPGSTFKGKVISIQPFGAFVDFGAFTDGLVHVSRLTDGFVKDIGSIVKVGQEVIVRLIEADMEKGRISLSMRENDDPSKSRVGGLSSEKSLPPRKYNPNRDDTKKMSKFVKGQDLEGTVKNKTRAGAFISLPEGEEGFLPSSEEDDEGFGNISGGSSLNVGNEVSVRVLRVTRGQVTLTMKKDVTESDDTLSQSQGVIHTATNPFVLAFRSNKVISAFLDEREKVNEIVEEAKEIIENEDEAKEIAVYDALVKDEEQTKKPDNGVPCDTQSDSAEQADDVLGKNEDQIERTSTHLSGPRDEEETAAALSPDKNGSIESSNIEAKSTECGFGGEVGDNSEGTVSVSELKAQTSASRNETTVKAAISPARVKQLRDETGAGMMDCKKALSETDGDLIKAQEHLRKKGLASADKKASRATAEGRIVSYVHEGRIGVLLELNCETDFVARGDIFRELAEDLAMQVVACPQVQYVNVEDVPKEFIDKEREIETQKDDLMSKPEHIKSKIVDGRVRKRLEEVVLMEQPFIKNDKVVLKDLVKQIISTIGENIKVKRFVRYNLGEGFETKNEDVTTKSITTSVQREESRNVAVSAAVVKQLRDETGAGMMDCKNALSNTGGDLDRAHDYLRKKGLSTAGKTSNRFAAQGRIGSYIHDSRIGVLIEVGCETDSVGRSEDLKQLVDDLAMQVVACPGVRHVSIEDTPESTVDKEKQLEMEREDLQSKPDNIRKKIIDGRVAKRLGELALLEQPFVKNDTMLVKDLVKQTFAALGENVKIRRFVRFALGETSDAKLENEA